MFNDDIYHFGTEDLARSFVFVFIIIINKVVGVHGSGCVDCTEGEIGGSLQRFAELGSHPCQSLYLVSRDLQYSQSRYTTVIYIYISPLI